MIICISLCTDWSVSCKVNNGDCGHLCQQTILGAKCSCHRGYMLQDDGRGCEDFDECSMDDVCSQICVNSPGSFRCDCAAGYILKPDGRGCKAQGIQFYDF